MGGNVPPRIKASRRALLAALKRDGGENSLADAAREFRSDHEFILEAIAVNHLGGHRSGYSTYSKNQSIVESR